SLSSRAQGVLHRRVAELVWQQAHGVDAGIGPALEGIGGTRRDHDARHLAERLARPRGVETEALSQAGVVRPWEVGMVRPAAILPPTVDEAVIGRRVNLH